MKTLKSPLLLLLIVLALPVLAAPEHEFKRGWDSLRFGLEFVDGDYSGTDSVVSIYRTEQGGHVFYNESGKIVSFPITEEQMTRAIDLLSELFSDSKYKFDINPDGPFPQLTLHLDINRNFYGVRFFSDVFTRTESEEILHSFHSVRDTIREMNPAQQGAAANP